MKCPECGTKLVKVLGYRPHQTQPSVMVEFDTHVCPKCQDTLFPVVDDSKQAPWNPQVDSGRKR